jgi:hypothetical protein
MLFKQYQVVRVQKLVQPPGDYDGWRVNHRPPQVGDTGTIVEILAAAGVADKYVVESVAPDGRTIWLDDFLAEELEPLAS